LDIAKPQAYLALELLVEQGAILPGGEVPELDPSRNRVPQFSPGREFREGYVRSDSWGKIESRRTSVVGIRETAAVSSCFQNTFEPAKVISVRDTGDPNTTTVVKHYIESSILGLNRPVE